MINEDAAPSESGLARLLATFRTQVGPAPAAPPLEAGAGAVSDVMFGVHVVSYGREVAEAAVVEAVHLPWEAVIRQLHVDPALLRSFDWRKLEDAVASAYAAAGFEIAVTPRPGDGGRDIVAIRRDLFSVRVLEPVKVYPTPGVVSADDVRAIVSPLPTDQPGSKAYVSTTSDFAPGVAQDFKALIPNRLELRNGMRLDSWFRGLARRRNPTTIA